MGNEKLSINPPIIQSAITGIANNAFCQKMLVLGAGMVTLGGLSVDMKTQYATYQMIKMGRKEFELPKGRKDIEQWCLSNLKLHKMNSRQLIAINTRISTVDNTSELWLENILQYADIIEINAHCRQPEIINEGAGEILLKDLDKFDEILSNLTDILSNIKLGIKIRGYRVENLTQLVKMVEYYNIQYIHIDAMVPGVDRANLKILREFVNSTDTPIIGNNSVRSSKEIKEMLDIGCIAISIARPLIENPEFMRELIDEYLGKENEFSNNYSI